MKMAWGVLSSVRLHTDRIGESEVPQPSRFFPQIIGSPIRGEGGGNRSEKFRQGRTLTRFEPTPIRV